MKFIINNDNTTAELGYGKLPVSPNDQAGYRPLELFVSSLAGCSGTVLWNILQKKRLGVERIEAEVSVSRIPEEANRIKKLAISAEVHADQALSAEQAAKVAELTVKNCGMIQSVIGSIDISYEVTFTGDSD
ncbi:MULTISPECIES: OsmC family protein [Cytobacillus]|uniref:OsmC family protein n=1 Tax=Cytobacillus firmus TaxID=1399 RepID=A0AA46Q160_CYTFI|nr:MULTISPECIES: OsmC family protein [Cytobacillus]MCC3649026.1 OsmC family protein [Cytobacillus oceanisediminis]MCU1807971.1 OsmC family protein [Cytobacillus firmus]UYG97465.1 OsmC family protein [Cytobacillus firmus]WHY34839.1 OsmC family protein [Cytobacillus firmus]